MPSLLSPKAVKTYRKGQKEATKDFLSYMEKSRDKSSGEIENFEFCLNKWALESVAVALLDTRFVPIVISTYQFQQYFILYRIVC